MMRKPFYVALCGLDGVGKTSVLGQMAETDDSGFYFVSRGPADCERSAERLIARTFHDWRDWAQGPRAQAIAVACAFDYVNYHERVLAPILDGRATALLSVHTPKVVVSDRHAICFKAYALCNPKPDPLALALLNAIPEPDLVIHLVLSREQIERRWGDATLVDEFQDLSMQALQQASYSKVFSTLVCPVHNIENDGSIEQTCKKIIETIEEYL